LVAALAANSRKAGFPIVAAASPPGWNPEIARQPMQNRRQPPMTLPCGALFSPPGKCYAGSQFVQYLRE